MKNTLSIEQATEVIASAFLPLRCFVETDDAESRVSFRILNQHDDVVLSIEDLFATNVSDIDRLEAVLTQVRIRVEAAGETLAPWHFPQT